MTSDAGRKPPLWVGLERFPFPSAATNPPMPHIIGTARRP